MGIIIYVLNVVGRSSTINYKRKIMKAPHDDNKLEIKCQSLVLTYITHTSVYLTCLLNLFKKTSYRDDGDDEKILQLQVQQLVLKNMKWKWYQQVEQWEQLDQHQYHQQKLQDIM